PWSRANAECTELASTATAPSAPTASAHGTTTPSQLGSNARAREVEPSLVATTSPPPIPTAAPPPSPPAEDKLEAAPITPRSGSAAVPRPADAPTVNTAGPTEGRAIPRVAAPAPHDTGSDLGPGPTTARVDAQADVPRRSVPEPQAPPIPQT